MPTARTCIAISLALAAAASLPARACRISPPQQSISVETQLRQAQDVYLAKAVSATATPDGEARFTFVVLQRLAGADRTGFTLQGKSAGPAARPSAFANHAEEVFWGTYGGRLYSDTDCKIHPRFDVGKTYLVFLDQPVNRRSYEEIAMPFGQAPDDRWLAYVTEQLSKRP